MSKVAVVLSGSGIWDGSECNESVITVLALHRLGAEVVFTAPNRPQAVSIDHVTQEPSGESRNAMVEAARIARSEITDLASLSVDDVDAAILPGGMGAALTLCTFAKGEDPWETDPDVESFLRGLYAAGKPIGAMCIAPTILAGLFGSDGVVLTIGNDEGTAARLTAAGAKHEICTVDEVAVDHEKKIVTTPAYMLGQNISEVAGGIEKLCAAVVEMA